MDSSHKKSVKPARCRYEDFVESMPADPASLRKLDEELTRLYADELARFDGWANKGIALLGASGMVLALASLGLPLLRRPAGLDCPAQVACFLLLRVAPFIAALISFLGSSVFALISLRPRSVDRLDADTLVRLASTGRSDFDRTVAAMRLSSYKNNLNEVDDKATQVNRSWRFFFWGSVAMAVFAATLLLLGY